MKISPTVRNQRVQQMYRKYGKTIYARCRRLLNDPDDAEDAAQEVFVRVLKHLEAAPSEEEALPWIYRISANYCFNQIRNQQTRSKHLEQAPRHRTHDEFVHAVENRDLAKKLVKEVITDHRVALVMYHVDEMDQQSIADTLRVSRRTVINWINAARQYLAKSDLNEG